MDPVILFILVAVVALGSALWYFNRDSSSLDINQDGGATLNDIDVTVEKTVADVKEEVKKKLPTKSKLAAMKKSEIEALGREFGVELDRRKTKNNMIADLQTEVKKQ